MTVTLADVIFEAARRSAAAFESTCTANGDTSNLVDAVLTDNGQDPTFLQGAWIYRPDATNVSDRQRRISDDGFNPNTGDVNVRRPWAVAPVSGERYQVYSLLPPHEEPGATIESWTRLVNRGLRQMFFLAEWPVGRGGAPLPGGATSTGRRRWPLERQEVTLIAAVSVAGGTAATITAPTGWTLISTISSGTDVQLAIYRKRSLITDPVEWTWTLDSARAAGGIIAAYVEANPTSPIDTFSSTSVSASTTITTPTVNTAQGDEVVLRIVGASGSAAFTGATNLYSRQDVVGLDGAAQVGLALFDNTITNATSAGGDVLTASTAEVLVAYTLALARRDTLRRTDFSGVTSNNNGTGTTSLVLTRPLQLPNDDWVPNRQSVRQVLFRNYPAGYTSEYQGQAIDIDVNKGGRTADVLEDGIVRTLVTNVAPATNVDVVLVVQRPYPELTDDLEETPCPLDLASLRGRLELYAYLNSAPQSRGEYDKELIVAEFEWADKYKVYKPAMAMVGIG